MPKKNINPLIDEFLLSIEQIPAHIVQSEKVTEKLLNKKLTRKQKASVKYIAALHNYKKAVTRYKRATTLLEKHYKILTRLVNKFGTDKPADNDNEG